MRASIAATAGLAITAEPACATAQQLVDADFEPAVPSAVPSGRLRVWMSDRCIVASRAQASAARFAHARQDSARMGWPVVVRKSGGSAVVHRPGIVNVSWRRPWSDASRDWMSAGYGDFLSLLIGAMRLLGTNCDAGAVAGSHCDGRYNLRLHGKKLGGTAAFLGGAGAARFSVFHASIHVRGSIDSDLTAIERFERALGLDRRYERSAHVALSEVVGRHEPFALRSVRGAGSTHEQSLQRL